MTIRRSLAFSFIDRYASLAVSIGSTVILARLLTPDEVGAFSVTMVIISMMSTVRDLGAGQYLVQEKDLTNDRIRAVWSVQLGLGLLLALGVLAASVPAGLFYGDTRVRDIMLVLALGYVINPFGSVTYAWLMREMRYDATAVIRFCAGGVGMAVSVLLAWQGVGAISLAWGSLASTVANALVATCYRPRGYPWLPGMREVRRVLSFGSQLTLSSVAETLSKGAPEFVLGKLQGLGAAGLYSRANGLVSLFNRLVTDAAAVVAISGFAKHAREARDNRGPFLLATAHVTALCWAFAGALACLAHPVVRLLYGPQWEAAVPLVQWLAAALALTAPVPLCTAALTGTGHAAQVLRASLFSGLAAVPLVVAGAFWSLQGAAMATVAASAVGTVFWLTATKRIIGFSWRELWGAMQRSAAVAIAASAAPAAVLLAWGPAHGRVLPALLLGGGGAALGFVAGVWLTRHPLREELLGLARRVSPFLAPRRARD